MLLELQLFTVSCCFKLLLIHYWNDFSAFNLNFNLEVLCFLPLMSRVSPGVLNGHLPLNVHVDGRYLQRNQKQINRINAKKQHQSKESIQHRRFTFAGNMSLVCGNPIKLTVNGMRRPA